MYNQFVYKIQSIRTNKYIFSFGLCNKYNSSFPSQLTAKVAPEEFAETINKVNREVRKHIDFTWKALVLGKTIASRDMMHDMHLYVTKRHKTQKCIDFM